MSNKNLILVRGVSGAGKSTIAGILDTSLRSRSFSTDDMFIVPGCFVCSDDENIEHECTGYQSRYVFEPSKLPEYHAATVDSVHKAMRMDDVDLIVVHNTFTQKWEMLEYIKLAKEYKWTLHTIVVENRHGSKSIHNVPEYSIEKQRDRFEVIL